MTEKCPLITEKCQCTTEKCHFTHLVPEALLEQAEHEVEHVGGVAELLLELLLLELLRRLPMTEPRSDTPLYPWVATVNQG
jgi:hypothetical protein